MKRKSISNNDGSSYGILSMVGCGGAKTDSTASTTTTEKKQKQRQQKLQILLHQQMQL